MASLTRFAARSRSASFLSLWSFPESAEFALDAGVAHEMRRDSASAALWYRRAATRTAPTDVRRFAESLPVRFRAAP